MVLGEVPRMRVSHPRDHPPGAFRGVQDEILKILKGTEKYKTVEEKFDQHVARALE